MWPTCRNTTLKWKPRLGIYSNSTKTCTYNPKTKKAYSYGHWCFLMEIEGKLVFNSHSFSPTTSNHQSAVLDLLKQLKVKIDAYIDTRLSLSETVFISHLPDIYKSLFSNEIEAARKTSKGWMHETRLNKIQSCKDKIALINAMGYKISKKEIAKIKKSCEAAEKTRNETIALNRRIAAQRRKQQKVVKQTNKVFNLNVLKRSA